MKTISFKAAQASRYVEEIKESLAALKKIRSKELKQLNVETDILHIYETLTKYQKGKLYRSIDARLKWLKGLNRKICFIQNRLPSVLLLLENFQKSESETIKRSPGPSLLLANNDD